MGDWCSARKQLRHLRITSAPCKRITRAEVNEMYWRRSSSIQCKWPSTFSCFDRSVSSSWTFYFRLALRYRNRLWPRVYLLPPRYSLYRIILCNFDPLLVIFLKMSERIWYSWLFEIIFSPSLQSYWISSWVNLKLLRPNLVSTFRLYGEKERFINLGIYILT